MDLDDNNLNNLGASSIVGVAIVCDDGVCTMQKIDGHSYQETTFVYMGAEDKEKGNNSNNSNNNTLNGLNTLNGVNNSNLSLGKLTGQRTPYPIVKYSDILEDPEFVIHETKEAIRRIRNTAYESCLDNFDKTKGALEDLNQAFEDFSEVQADASYNVIENLKELEQIREFYLKNPPLEDDEDNIENYEATLDDLKRHHAFAVDIMNMCDAVSHKRDKIIKWTNDILLLTQQLQEASATMIPPQ